MKGKLLIDGIDVYEEYGIYVVEWKNLIAYPPLKKVEMNDWFEEDGVEVDLSSPVLDSREVQLKVAIKGDRHKELYSLINEILSKRAFHTFNFASIERQYLLRLVDVSNEIGVNGLGLATLRLAEDFPLRGYTYIPPQCNISIPKSDYFLANIPTPEYQSGRLPLSDYGIQVLQGTLDEILRNPKVKPNVLSDASIQIGVNHGWRRVTFRAKDVKLHCLMRANSLEELWRNYDALLYDLTRPDYRYLQTPNGVFPFFYKSCTVSRFYPFDKIWLQFTLTVTFTGYRGTIY